MIKKAKIKSPNGLPAPGNTVKNFIQTLEARGPITVKEPFTFDYFLKTAQETQSNNTKLAEVCSVEQEHLMKRLVSQIENKTIVYYLLNKMKSSRFKAYSSAMRVFCNMFEEYFNGSVNIEDIKSYQDNIPSNESEFWYEKFNELRFLLIDFIRNKNREEAFVRCIQILIDSEAFADLTSYHKDLAGYYENVKKLNHAYIIDLMEMVWPEQGGTLKLLFGSN